MIKIITTSWDDGHPLDFRIAELLYKYNLPGTFYIPKHNGKQVMISEGQIRELAGTFEVGGHTLNHILLRTASEKVLEEEIRGCYNWLEDVLGYTPVSFCFPGGSFSKASLAAVFRYGYKLARTTELLSTATIPPDCLLPTSLQVFEHSNVTYTKHLAKRGKWKRLGAKLLRYPSTDLVTLTSQYLDKIEEDGGGFHLWGHSWEIEAFGLWNKLEELLRLLAARKDFAFVSNGQLC